VLVYARIDGIDVGIGGRTELRPRLFRPSFAVAW
jgi:hypothetical protein